MYRIRILIVDDEKRVRDEIEEFLLDKHFKVFTASRPSEAYRLLEEKPVDIMLLDIKLPEEDGLSVLKKVKESHPSVEVIMISGHGDMSSVIDAMRNGAIDFFQKPFRLPEINNAIERTTRFINLQNKLKEVEKNYDLLSKELHNDIGQKLIGKSKAVKNVIEMMMKVSKTDDTAILITGESGTGKELVAKGIHYLSQRKNQYFYSVNCSAIPEPLFESEFFGHKKGAFTGASEDKAGWFEIANKGSLFLDEISDMPLSQQAKLLRVLEEKKVSRVGTHSEKNVDVRVIAASNQDLEKLAAEKKFRFDLYHRLSTFIIHIPPLRDRKEDIVPLADHFISEFSNKMAKKVRSTDRAVYEKLKAYSFPGNIRELRNIVERALIIADDDKLTADHFRIFGGSHQGDALLDENECLDLEETEKLLINKALKKSGYNKSKAAELLNITWQSLDRRMKKFNIENK